MTNEVLLQKVRVALRHYTTKKQYEILLKELESGMYVANEYYLEERPQEEKVFQTMKQYRSYLKQAIQKAQMDSGLKKDLLEAFLKYPSNKPMEEIKPFRKKNKGVLQQEQAFEDVKEKLRDFSDQKLHYLFLAAHPFQQELPHATKQEKIDFLATLFEKQPLETLCVLNQLLTSQEEILYAPHIR